MTIGDSYEVTKFSKIRRYVHDTTAASAELTDPAILSAVGLDRLPGRGTYDKAQIDGILKEGLTCHVAFVADGRPVCIPMIYAQLDEKIYLHGSIASRLLKSMKVTSLAMLQPLFAIRFRIAWMPT